LMAGALFVDASRKGREQDSVGERGILRRWVWVLAALLVVVLLAAGCGGEDEETTRATRTPVPTWTPTPVGAMPAAGVVEGQAAAPGVVVASTAVAALPVVADAAAGSAPAAGTGAEAAPAAEAAPPTAVVVNEEPTATPTELPTATPIPTATPTELPTATPIPTATPTPLPTDTPTPAPTPTPDWAFEIEEAAQFPTLTLAPNVVRIWVYAYSPADLGLGGFTLRVTHNGAPLTVDEVSTAGLPMQTRPDPGPFTRFANLSVLFVEPQAGTWEVQLVDSAGVAVGPPARFDLTADQVERELYVRYKLTRAL